MPVSALQWIRPARRRGRCWVSPDHRDWFDSLGLRTARDFLALPGIVVSGHVVRNVSRVTLGGTTAYLKREHRVRHRDRFRSWRDGFGWASLSAREAAVLRRLEEYGQPGPTRLACGEGDGQGFLLVEAAPNAVEFRSLSEVNDDLATRLGMTLARIHAAGIDQPDLFAKHVLVCPGSLAVTILDWQRAVVRSSVPWPNRIRGLAALRATTPPELLPDHVWDHLLAAYLNEAAGRGQTFPGPDTFRTAIKATAARLLVRPAVRAQRRMAAVPVRQELVRIGGETACAVPEIAPALASPSAVACLYDPAAAGRHVSLPTGRTGILRVRRYGLPLGRWWAAARGRAWRSPELRAARLLFHLERHGIPGPKLLAYGQRVPWLGQADSFLLIEPLPADPIGPGDAAAVRALLDRLHEAGCRITALGPRGEPFGVRGGCVLIEDVHRLRLVKRLTRRKIGGDRARLAAYFQGLR